jgi:hypothetical protein
MPNEKLKQVYDKLSKVAKVPDYATFEQKYSSQEGFDSLYTKIQKANIEVPDYNTFKSRYYESTTDPKTVLDSNIKTLQDKKVNLNDTTKQHQKPSIGEVYSKVNETDKSIFIAIFIVSALFLKYLLSRTNPSNKGSYLQLTILELFSRFFNDLKEFLLSIKKLLLETPIIKLFGYILLLPFLPFILMFYFLGIYKGVKNKTTRYKTILYSFCILILPVIFYGLWILYNYGYFKSEEKSNMVVKTIETEASTTNKKIEINIDTSTIYGKLDHDFLSGNFSVFKFDDKNNFFKTNIKVNYSNRMLYAPGDKKRTIVKFGIMDGKEQFRCIINFQPTNTRELTSDEKKQLLSTESVTEILNSLKEYYGKVDILDITENITVANQFSTSYEYYLVSNLGGYNYHIARQYSFYYKGGNGGIQFYMDSNNDSEEFLVNKFRKYNSVINRITNSLEIEEQL